MGTPLNCGNLITKLPDSRAELTKYGNFVTFFNPSFLTYFRQLWEFPNILGYVEDTFLFNLEAGEEVLEKVLN